LQLFVAHGRKQGPVDQLTKILSEFGIPFVVAETEPHAGRPISQKVRDLMDACTAGVYVFTADEKFTDEKGNVIWRPRENVVYELGAGSYKYGTKIVVFKEKEVSFPSDYQNLGYIEFEEGQLQAKTLELIRELVALKALRWTPGQ
jgi:predicted nucleotide-binding protein